MYHLRKATNVRSNIGRKALYAVIPAYKCTYDLYYNFCSGSWFGTLPGIN